MAKVLVTGGAGFIGSHLCDRLVERGDEVIVLDNFSYGKRKNLAAIEDRIHIIEDSVQNIGKHAAALAGVERVYHLAALISGYDSLKEPELYFDANITGLLRLLEVCKGLPGVRVLFASSSTVYGNREEPLRSESDMAAPVTTYALSKYAGEHLLSMYAPLYGFDYTCLRLFNVYGPRQNPDHPYANVTCKFAHAAATGGTVALYGDGSQTRDFVYVDDVVECFLRAGEKKPQRIYNVGTGKDASIRSLLDLVSSIAGVTIPVDQRGPWPNDIRAIRANIDLLRHDFGFEPQVQLEQGLARTVEFFRGRTHA
jgi:UDP-glucose 4-epimerase